MTSASPTPFDDALHPRGGDGRFAEKDRDETPVALAATAEQGDDSDGTGVERPGLWCESCSAETEPGTGVRLYECTSCGETSPERRCESCNKFKSRADDEACAECEQPLVETSLTTDHDGTTILFDDFDASSDEPFADRLARQQEESRTRAAAEAARKQQSLDAASRPTTWGKVTPGTVVLLGPTADWDDGVRIVRYTRSVRDEDGASRVVVCLANFGSRVHIFDAEEPVMESTLAPRDLSSDSLSDEDIDGADQPVVGLARVPDGPMRASSSPSGYVGVDFGYATRDGGLLPTLSLSLTTSRNGGLVMRVGCWNDPDLAAADLDVLEQAARDYANTLAGAAETTTDARSSHAHDEAATVTDRLSVTDEGGWLHAEPFTPGAIQIGEDNWHSGKGPLLNIRTSRGNGTVADPAGLLAAVGAARGFLDRLTGIPKRVPSRD